jgi:hypothetical protein
MDIRKSTIEAQPVVLESSLEQNDGLNLSRFVSECQRVGSEIESVHQVDQVAQLLLQHANARLVLEIKPGSSLGSAVLVRVVSSRFEECPASLEQWAVSTAIQAHATGKPVSEATETTDGQRISMISAPLLTFNSQNTTILSTLFLDNSIESRLPFIQVASQCIENSFAHDRLLAFETTSQDVASLQEICLTVADSENVRTSGRKLANQLKTQIDSLSPPLEAEAKSLITVYLGTTAQDDLPKLASISDHDSLPEDDRLVEAIESAMAECISRNANAKWPPREDNFALLCHQKLSKTLDDHCIASYLLPDGNGNPQAVIVVASETPLNDRVNQFLTAGQTQLGLALSLAERGERNKLQQFIDSVKKSYTQKKTQTILKVVAAILLLGMIPLPYKIKATSEVQPAKKTFLYAPFAAPLKESLVEPGDIVQKGAELARLDDKELGLELAEVQADLHRTQKERDGFVATHSAGEARMAQHEAEMLQARFEILKQRSEQLILRSPIDGIVISGDWKNASGMPLETGQSLFEVAPLEQLSIDVYLPDEDIRYARPGQHIRIQFDAYPFESFSGKLTSIHPAAEINDSKNVFVGTVKIGNPQGKLRPGMKGTAHCSSSWQPIWWNLLHKPAAKCMRYFGW